MQGCSCFKYPPKWNQEQSVQCYETSECTWIGARKSDLVRVSLVVSSDRDGCIYAKWSRRHQKTTLSNDTRFENSTRMSHGPHQVIKRKMYLDDHSGVRGSTDPTMNARSHQVSPKHAAEAVDSRSNNKNHDKLKRYELPEAGLVDICNNEFTVRKRQEKHFFTRGILADQSFYCTSVGKSGI